MCSFVKKPQTLWNTNLRMSGAVTPANKDFISNRLQRNPKLHSALRNVGHEIQQSWLSMPFLNKDAPKFVTTTVSETVVYFPTLLSVSLVAIVNLNIIKIKLLRFPSIINILRRLLSLIVWIDMFFFTNFLARLSANSVPFPSQWCFFAIRGCQF